MACIPFVIETVVVEQLELVVFFTYFFAPAV
jgi:hypothetical protein